MELNLAEIAGPASSFGRTDRPTASAQLEPEPDSCIAPLCAAAGRSGRRAGATLWPVAKTHSAAAAPLIVANHAN